MIPSKSKALLMAANADDTRSLTCSWTGLGMAVLFLAFAAIVAG